MNKYASKLKVLLPNQYIWVKQKLTSRRQAQLEKTARKIGYSKSYNTIVANLGTFEKNEEIECPVCKSFRTKPINLEWGGSQVQKRICSDCNHLFLHRWLDGLDQVAAEFMYEPKSKPDEKFHQETRLVEKSIETFRKLNGEHTPQNHLIFGIGKNLPLIDAMASIHSESYFEIEGCDLIQCHHDRYFTTYKDDTKLGKFGSISSHAVVEHLENTLDAWVYMNRLLKPVAEHDSVMVHAFPSLIHFGFEDWSVRIRSHTCLFSESSLAQACKFAGFNLMQTRISTGHHPIFTFLKVEDR